MFQGRGQQPRIASRLAEFLLLLRSWRRELAPRFSTTSDKDQVRADALGVGVEIETPKRARDQGCLRVKLVLRDGSTSDDGSSFRSPAQPAHEIPAEPPHISKERSMETGIRHDDRTTTGRKQVSKRSEKSCLHSRVSEPAFRMNLEIQRECSATDRHGSDESALLTDGLGPVHYDDRPRPNSPMSAPCSSAENAPDHRVKDQPPLRPQVAIPEQAIDPLDAVLRCRRASDPSTQGRERKPSNLDQRLYHCHKRTESNGMDLRATAGADLTYDTGDAHRDLPSCFDNPKRSRLAARRYLSRVTDRSPTLFRGETSGVRVG